MDAPLKAVKSLPAADEAEVLVIGPLEDAPHSDANHE
jgi:hypothetical protein